MAESRWLTSQHVQDEVQVSGEDLDALHAGDGPNGNELVAVHLRHQVQILGEVFSEDGREKGQRLLNAGTRRMIYTTGVTDVVPADHMGSPQTCCWDVSTTHSHPTFAESFLIIIQNSLM